MAKLSSHLHSVSDPFKHCIISTYSLYATPLLQTSLPERLETQRFLQLAT